MPTSIRYNSIANVAPLLFLVRAENVVHVEGIELVDTDE
jgi:hypothetical protein